LVIDRFKEIPHEGGMADLVWSDPDPERDEFAISQRLDISPRFILIEGELGINLAHKSSRNFYT